MLRIPDRGRQVTDEPQTIAPNLMGASLATFRRRAAAYILDLLLFSIVVGALFLGFSLADFHRRNPTFIPRIGEMRAATDTTTVAQLKNDLLLDFLAAVNERCSEALPEEMVNLVEARDFASLDESYLEEDLTVAFGKGATRMTRSSPRNLIIGKDFLFGSSSTFFSWGAFFVGWFTLWLWLTRGRSPGKALFRMKVVRLDGKPLRLWDSFCRAGGYSASTATLLLGFAEAIWHPNRQAMHDKIAGTVVLKI